MARKTIKLKYGIELKEPRRFPPWLKMLLVIAVVVVGIYVMRHFVIWVLAPTEEEIAVMNATPTPFVPTPTASPTATPTPRPSPTLNQDLSYELSSTRQYGDHVKGWIDIPGLGVNIVVVQWRDNQYFKDHDFTLNANMDGAVYLDTECDLGYIEEESNIVIYGYNNLGGHQLKNIVKYVHEDNFDYSTLIMFETIYGKYNFRLFSVHIEQDDADYIAPVSSKDRRDFIQTLVDKSMFEPEYTPPADAVLLTFTTDVESSSGTRFLVHAYLEQD